MLDPEEQVLDLPGARLRRQEFERHFFAQRNLASCEPFARVLRIFVERLEGEFGNSLQPQHPVAFCRIEPFPAVKRSTRHSGDAEKFLDRDPDFSVYIPKRLGRDAVLDFLVQENAVAPKNGEWHLADM